MIILNGNHLKKFYSFDLTFLEPKNNFRHKHSISFYVKLNQMDRLVTQIKNYKLETKGLLAELRGRNKSNAIKIYITGLHNNM